MVLGCTGSDGRSIREQISARRVPAVDLRPVNGRVGQPGDVGRRPLGLLGQRPMARADSTPLVSITLRDALRHRHNSQLERMQIKPGFHSNAIACVAFVA